MTNEDISLLLLRRYSAAQHPLCELLLHLHVQQQRLRAQCLAQGAGAVKRAFDILVSFTLPLVISPLLLLIAALVWIEDGGSVFCAPTRVGKYGREFKMYRN